MIEHQHVGNRNWSTNPDTILPVAVVLSDNENYRNLVDLMGTQCSYNLCGREVDCFLFSLTITPASVCLD